MELKLIDDKGQKHEPVAASDTLFGRDYNEALIHQVVVAYQANAPAGHARAEGPRRHQQVAQEAVAQKGTGRARAGQANSPLWRGGGKIFPTSPDENFSQKVNRKMYRAGIASILSQLVREDRLSVIEPLALDAPKTKLLRAEDQGVRPDRHGADRHRQARREPVPVVAQPARTCWCSRRARSIR